MKQPYTQFHWDCPLPKKLAAAKVFGVDSSNMSLNEWRPIGTMYCFFTKGVPTKGTLVATDLPIFDRVHRLNCLICACNSISYAPISSCSPLLIVVTLSKKHTPVSTALYSHKNSPAATSKNLHGLIMDQSRRSNLPGEVPQLSQQHATSHEKIITLCFRVPHGLNRCPASWWR